MILKLPVEKDDFLRLPPLDIPTPVVRDLFSVNDVIHALGISRSAFYRYDAMREGAPYPYIPQAYTTDLFNLAERKHVDLVSAINAWFSAQDFNEAV